MLVSLTKYSPSSLNSYSTLGSRFDERAFHDRILGLGAVPLNVLEDQMRLFIRQESAKAPKPS